MAGDLRLLFSHDNRFGTGYRTKLYPLNAGVAFHLGGSWRPDPPSSAITDETVGGATLDIARSQP
jgi:hypothetical protein